MSTFCSKAPTCSPRSITDRSPPCRTSRLCRTPSTNTDGCSARRGTSSPAAAIRRAAIPAAALLPPTASRASPDPTRRGQQWSTGPIEITDGPPSLMFKGTLGETAGWGGSGMTRPPGRARRRSDAVPRVDRRDGARRRDRDDLEHPLHHGVHGDERRGRRARGRRQARECPRVHHDLDENIRKIATILPVSEEMLDDAPAIQQWISSRLVSFVQIETERQLLRGSAGGAEGQGLLTSRGIPVYNGGTAAGNRAEELFKAMNSMRGIRVPRTRVGARLTVRLRNHSLAEGRQRPAVRRRPVFLGRTAMAASPARAVRRPAPLTSCGARTASCPRRWVPARRWLARGQPRPCSVAAACPSRRQTATAISSS